VFFSSPEMARLLGVTADQSSCVIYVPGNLGIEPTTTDRMKVIGTINGQVDPDFKIIKVDRTDPDGNGIMFKCFCIAWPGDEKVQ
jgi:hypothetical protein